MAHDMMTVQVQADVLQGQLDATRAENVVLIHDHKKGPCPIRDIDPNTQAHPTPNLRQQAA